ncbi:MAG: bacteriocin [Nannocystaceae bacterium]
MAEELSEADLAQITGGRATVGQEPDWVPTYSNLGGGGLEEDD